MDSIRKIKVSLKKISAVFLLLSITLTTCSCDIMNRILDKVELIVSGELELIQTPVYKEEMVRLTIAAINDTNALSDSYSSIPEAQRGNVSYAMFSEYINILRTYSQQGIKRTITAFTMLNDEQLLDIVGENVIDRYPGLVGAELSFSVESENPAYVFLILNEEGIPVLSADWIRGCISIYNYADRYFSALEERNIEGVLALISPSFIGEIYTDAVLRAKASALTSYYQTQVRSPRTAFVYTSLLPQQLDICIPRTLDSNNSEVSHSLNITLSGNSYRISDCIPISPDISSMTVNRGDSTLIRCGSYFSRDLFMYGTMGMPIYYTRGADSLDERVSEDGTVQIKRRIVVNYQGIMIVLEAYLTADGWVDGTVKSLIITGGDYLVGNQISIGMNISELIVNYPNIDNENYTLTYIEQGITYTTSFEFDEENNISRIRIDAQE